MFYKKSKIVGKIIIALVVIICSFSAGMLFSNKSELIANLADRQVEYSGEILNKYGIGDENYDKDIDFGLFWEVWDILKEEYVNKEKLNEKEMFYGALRGLASSLNDPYTIFMDPKITEDFENDLTGTFEGIGAEIGIKNDILTIIAPLDGMPAQKAGILSGDKVYAIDGEITADITVDEAVNRIRGPKGTTVVLTIVRNGFETAEDISITRGLIKVESVKTSMVDNGLFIIKITNFNSDIYTGLNKAVTKILNANPRGIIVDLRNNPGGYLDTAIEVASEWVEEGVIVIERFSEENQNEYLARGRARLKDYPTVVLVNGGSASASEIVAGALRDHGKAKIIGKTTFGKGSVQTLEELGDGSSLKITVAEWLTPNGDCINDVGIEPDITVDLTVDDYNDNKDPQMDKAIEIMLNSQ